MRRAAVGPQTRRGIVPLMAAALMLGRPPASPLAAQTVVAELAHASTPTDPSTPPDRDIDLLSAIVTRAMPASFQVISVPLPDALAGAAPVAFEIRDTGLGRIVGRRAGVVSGGSLVVTVGVPRDALAGLRTFAHVRFTAAGRRGVEIPLVLDVGVVRRVHVSIPRAGQGAAAGVRLNLTYRLTNEGNAPDSVVVQAELPGGWRQLDKPRPVVLEPRATADRSIRIALPPSAHAGTVRVQVVATAGSEERARAAAIVEVADASVSGRHAGPRLSTGLATVWTGDDATTLVAAEIFGRLSDSVSVRGRVVSDLAPEPDALRGLARVGYGGTPWYLSLEAPAWRADLGAIRVGHTSLTGESASGTGASAFAATDAWSVAAFGAAAAAGLREGSAEFAGLRLARVLDSVEVGATVTHLDERAAFGRRLDAFGLDARAPTLFGATAAGELAWRRHEGGSGLGWATELARRGDDGDYLRVRVASAPGGSAAFARGTRELSASASRRTSPRTALGGALWRSSDASTAGQRTAITGWSLAPRVQLSDDAALSLEVGGHDFETRSTAAGFGSGERRVGLVLDGRWGSLHGSTGVQYGAVDRTVDLPSGAAYRTGASRATWRGLVATGGRWGAVDLTAQVERSGAGSGYEPRRNEAQLRVQGPILAMGGTDLGLRGELHHYGWFGDRTSIAVVRAAADLQLPWSIRLTLDAERNPLFSALAGGSPWSTALRVTRTTALPRLFTEYAAEGVVYQDLDGDGRRDSTEPGMASAVVRLGRQHAPTDERGRFVFGTREGDAPRLDVRSVPLGWIVTGRHVERDGAWVEIGVAPTSTARIRLAVDSGRAELALRAPLSLVRVSVRDDNGREWIAPVDASGSAFFDALPAGRYEIVLDVGRLPEPVSVLGESRFVVGADGSAIERTMLLRTRPVRLRRIEPGAAADGASAPPPTDSTRSLRSDTAPTLTDREPALETSAVRVGLDAAHDRRPVTTGEGALVSDGHTVLRNETLRKLAQRFLFDEMKWPVLYELNSDGIADPDRIRAGQRLQVLRMASPRDTVLVELPGRPRVPRP